MSYSPELLYQINQLLVQVQTKAYQFKFTVPLCLIWGLIRIVLMLYLVICSRFVHPSFPQTYLYKIYQSFTFLNYFHKLTKALNYSQNYPKKKGSRTKITSALIRATVRVLSRSLLKPGLARIDLLPDLLQLLHCSRACGGRYNNSFRILPGGLAPGSLVLYQNMRRLHYLSIRRRRTTGFVFPLVTRFTMVRRVIVFGFLGGRVTGAAVLVGFRIGSCFLGRSLVGFHGVWRIHRVEAIAWRRGLYGLYCYRVLLFGAGCAAASRGLGTTV